MFHLTYDEERRLNDNLGMGMLWVSLPTFLLLRYIIPSPWGKTLLSKRKSMNLGPLLPPRMSWFVFESPNLIWSLVCWREASYAPRRNDNHPNQVNQILLLLFVFHYVQRAIVYPLLVSKNTRPMPLAVVLAAFGFCNVNGYLQAQSLCQFQFYPDYWHYTAQFRFGLVLFFTGFAINIQSDAILRQLRQTHSSYQIPRGGLFECVSAPHYLGEMVEWTGFCVACGLPKASLAFAVFTAANLIPRALAHHEWYRSTFSSSYPPHRKAIIPFVW